MAQFDQSAFAAPRQKTGWERDFRISEKNAFSVPIRNFYVLCFQRVDSLGSAFCVPIRIPPSSLVQPTMFCKTYGHCVSLCYHGAFRDENTAPRALSYFFSRIWMVARVTSQSKFIAQPTPALTREIVKSSRGDSSFWTRMVVRVRSYCSPGYGIPHTGPPLSFLVFLLMMSVHESGPGIASSV